jgi:hypothetical protein
VYDVNVQNYEVNIANVQHYEVNMKHVKTRLGFTWEYKRTFIVGDVATKIILPHGVGEGDRICRYDPDKSIGRYEAI